MNAKGDKKKRWAMESAKITTMYKQKPEPTKLITLYLRVHAN